MSHTFYIVDVFAEEKYAGNQLAVVRGAADLDTVTMQRIAQEMHFSETTFILSDDERDGGYDVRIFTASDELRFAGHPTLGTAFVIQQYILGIPFEKVTLNLKVGPVPVTLTYRDGAPDVLWMRPQSATFGPEADGAALAEAMGLSAADVDTRFPVQAVSVGEPFVILPLRTLDAVRRARVNPEPYLAAAHAIGGRWAYFFCPQPENPANHLHSRMVAVDKSGPWEDPATGSANCCLAAWLSRHRYFGSDRVDVRVEQGYEMGRPSLLYLRAAPDGDRIAVDVGGRVFAVAEGTLV